MARTPDQTAKMIFTQWKASLSSERNIHTNNAPENFSALWDDMYRYGVPYDVAYSYINEAVGAHSPRRSTVSYVYKQTPHGDLSEREFADKWIEKIRSFAISAFHEFYPIDDIIPKEQQVKPKQEKVVLPTGMTKQEYSRQRRYMEQFPILTPEEIEKRFAEVEREVEQDDLALKYEDMFDE